MPPSSENDKTKAMLLSTKFRFSPETQAIKETALERAIEHILFALANPNPIDIVEMQKGIRETNRRISHRSNDH